MKVMRNAKNKESVLRILEAMARTLFFTISHLPGHMTSWESVTPTGYQSFVLSVIFTLPLCNYWE